jgi:tetratricopeptide (TPR) repeat protein
LLGTWAISSFMTFWSTDDQGVQLLTPRDPEVLLWTTPDAGSDARGGIPALERSVVRSWDHPLAHTRLAQARLHRGDTEGAIAAAREAIAVDPWHAHAHYALALGYHASGDLDGALAHVDLAARLGPESVPFVLDLSTLLFRAERYGEAEVALERTRAALVRAGLPVHPRIAELLAMCRSKR